MAAGVNLDTYWMSKPGGRFGFREKYLNRMPEKNGREMTCKELHQEISAQGIKLDYDSQVFPMCSALKSGKNMLFMGPPGTAKTITALALSRILKKRGGVGREDKEYNIELFRISANKDMTASDFFGDWKFPQQILDSMRFNTLNHETSPDFFDAKYFNKGPALKAVEEGGILLVDEINRAGSDFPNLLFEIAEERQVTLPLYNKGQAIFNADRRYPIIIGTMNEIDTGTTREMSSALVRRFATINFPNSDAIVMQDVFNENYGESVVEDATRIVRKILAETPASSGIKRLKAEK
jgi:MoxR-like ATPase